MVRQKNLNVRSTCPSAVGGLTHCSIPGMPMIDRFHKNPDTWIFLISTLAGGTGLNLVGANKVVIFGVSPRPPPTNRGLFFGQIRIGVSVHVSPSGNSGLIKG